MSSAAMPEPTTRPPNATARYGAIRSLASRSAACVAATTASATTNTARTAGDPTSRRRRHSSASASTGSSTASALADRVTTRAHCGTSAGSRIDAICAIAATAAPDMSCPETAVPEAPRW